MIKGYEKALAYLSEIGRDPLRIANEFGVLVAKTENGYTPTVAVTDKGHKKDQEVHLGPLLKGTENTSATVHSHGNSSANDDQ